MGAISKKRLRIFAGPNGSGKSTITNIVLDYVHLGTYVNADDIKVILSEKRFPELNKHRVKTRVAQGGHPVAGCQRTGGRRRI